jgi:Peptidase M15
VFDELSPGGQVLYMLARTFGARVTGGKRTPDENAKVGGITNSKHLTGDAIDIAADAPPLALSMLGVFGKVVPDEGGTAPHFHVETTTLTLPLFVGLVVVGGRALR